MARREKSPPRKRSRVRTAKKSAKRTAKKITARSRPARRAAKKEQPTAAPQPAAPARPRPRPPRVSAITARPIKREPDIPLDVLDRTYTPKQTSLKAPFRTDGDDRQRDQELTAGYDDTWNEEDRFTNKSGDPRIGTHHRKYEPGE
jgi:hypothetical protein